MHTMGYYAAVNSDVKEIFAGTKVGWQAKGQEGSFWDNGHVLKLDYGDVALLHKYTKTHQTVTFRWVFFWYVNFTSKIGLREGKIFLLYGYGVISKIKQKKQGGEMWGGHGINTNIQTHLPIYF